MTSQSLLLSFESRLQPPSSSAGYLEASVTMNVQKISFLENCWSEFTKIPFYIVMAPKHGLPLRKE